MGGSRAGERRILKRALHRGAPKISCPMAARAPCERMLEVCPSYDEFLKLAKHGNLIPLQTSILADRDTPVTVFERIRNHRYAFLLESVEHGSDTMQTGRYSFIGFDPEVVFEIRRPHVVRETADGQRTTIDTTGTGVMPVLRDAMAPYKPVAMEGVPPFIGGLVGFLGYDMVREFERIPDGNPNDLGLPDGVMVLARDVIAIDHVRRRLTLIVNAHIADPADPLSAYEKAVERLRALRDMVRRPAGAAADVELFAPDQAESPLPFDPATLVEHPVPRLEGDLPGLHLIRSSVSEAQFHSMVAKAREYILAGDAFQIVGSQRFHTRFDCDPFDIYRSLRDVNPSPYMYYLQFGELRLAGSSPEILVKLEGDTVRLRPIAGTRRRGVNAAEDRALEQELLADAKECAEHVMLVDLGRNDVGRVSQPGTVHVDQLMIIERYSHVMHIVSNVLGKLRPECDAFDVLAASFPAGTVSGAPKIRAMEIIDEIEGTRRGPYAGTVCYFSFNGNLDSAITIRTAILLGQHAFVQAGGGWVADSDPGAEYMETVNKARGVLRAIAQAQRGLD